MKAQTKEWKLCGWVEWMDDVMMNGGWIPCVSPVPLTPHFCLLNISFLSLQQPPLLQCCCVQDYILFEILFGFLCLCLPLNECVGHLPAYLCWMSLMTAAACEYVLYTCASIRERERETETESIMMCLSMCTSARKYIFFFIFTHLCVGMCVCCVGLYSNRRA